MLKATETLRGEITRAIQRDVFEHDPDAVFGLDVAVFGNAVRVFGELSSEYSPDYEGIVRAAIRSAELTHTAGRLDPDTCTIRVNVYEPPLAVLRSIAARIRSERESNVHG